MNDPISLCKSSATLLNGRKHAKTFAKLKSLQTSCHRYHVSNHMISRFPVETHSHSGDNGSLAKGQAHAACAKAASNLDDKS